MEEAIVSLTVSKVIDYLYCPRNIFYLDVLRIPKHETKDFKVKKGKEIHKNKLEQNANYLRKNLKVVKKEVDITLGSKKYLIHGKLDELLFLEDGTIVPLDYKFSEYTGKIYDTYKYQLVMYSILIEENYNVKSNRGYIVFTRSENKLVEVLYEENDFEKIKIIIKDIFNIINKGIFPLNIEYGRQCNDCYYKKLCNID